MMDKICRLCCSTKFVNNSIFDEDNALYLKMSLYLPIKVFKNDHLPQKVCDKCSCKVNDFYQFCNETIEVQNRLRSLLLSSETSLNSTVDLTIVKDSGSPPPTSISSHCERSTQTDSQHYNDAPYDFNVAVQISEEEKAVSLSPVKKEEDGDYPLDIVDHFDERSSDSEDVSLISLKKKKNKKPSVNGEVSEKRSRKKKESMKEWDMLMNSLPDATLSVVDKGEVGDVVLDSIKEELDEKSDKLKELDMYHCCVCSFQSYSRIEMLQHYRQHAEVVQGGPPPAPPPPDQDPLRCTRCRKVVTRSEWEHHWQRHWERDRRPYRCARCEKSFRDPYQILKHGMTHNFEESVNAEPVNKRFICDLCPEGFVYMRYLQAHRSRAHPEAAGRALALRCGQCARHFTHINSLRRHLRAHTGERNFLCNVCGKALSSREHLKFHIRIHTGYKPNICKTCGKGFVKKCNLTLHERVHSGEKPHVCSHCGKGFSQRSTLVIHERYHSGARPYVCGLCGRGFVAKGLLSMHLKTTCI